ncbi:hypothetical protein V1512DRAFT_207367 [Lipomyces arxii]|uniref:uncharacterized protein n=1 Tax=Lipomyces arxii TaxID=56418 RepID=UPI0034CE2740
MSTARFGDFSEKAIRREFRQYITEVRQIHESEVNNLIKGAREGKGAIVEDAFMTGSYRDYTLSAFMPTAKTSPKNVMKFTVDSFKKHENTRRQLRFESVPIPCQLALPLYKSYTPLSSGIHVEDDEFLRYLPYFGENGEEDGLNLEEMFEDRTDSHFELLKREKARFLSVNFLELMARYGLSKSQLMGYFLHHVTSNTQSQKLVMPDKFKMDEKKKKLLREHTRKLDNRSLAKVDMICRIFKDMTRISVLEILNVYPTDIFIEDKRSSLRSFQSSPVYALDSYSSLHCPFCHTHECSWHEPAYLTMGDNGSFRTSTLQETNTSNLSTAANKLLPDLVPCSADCYLNKSDKGELLQRWSDSEISLIKMTGGVMMSNNRTSCLLTTMMTRPCYEIQFKLDELKLTPKYFKANKPLLSRLNLSDPYTPQGLHKRKRKASTIYPDDCSLSGNHLKRGNVSPCMHKGPCGVNCACVSSKVFCEKSCACPASCPRRWRGCRCTASRCGTSACECFKWNRECDPDLCRTCGADEILDPKNRDIVENKRFCKNVNLQRGLGKRVIIGPSNVAGWGLFMGEPIKQDEYLGEYKGELISQDEAERRGKLYDKRGVSFLFESSKDQCVDATRAGDKLRFINHSRHSPNCHARILLVNGIHKIAFFAKRRIKEGEELFIDYGYNNKTIKFVPLEHAKRTELYGRE